ncbi:MAG TPA: molybdopterin-dependent oxidoreductase [Tepidisphaeraceae bacterium]|nr:molybdopterin-dependent oxidoreductase [Tepidisphaeraceae bacterium]
MMQRLWLVVLCAIFGALVGQAPSWGQGSGDGSVEVGGAVARPGSWTVSRINSELASEVKPVEYDSHGQKHTAHCIGLLSLLKACGAPTDLKMDPRADPKTKNLPMRMVVVVEASDGYAAVFSLGELMPQVGNKEVWLAMDLDGKPLPAGYGPLRLVIPSDAKPARGVHGISRITVFDAASAAQAKPRDGK